VLIAKRFIPAGTPVERILSFGPGGGYAHFAWWAVPTEQEEDALFRDPAGLAGQVTIVDIYPGQLLKAGFFGPP
jgi:hypothetical protein